MPQGRHIEALYLHVPFCAHRCLYCGFYSRATRRGSDQMALYIDALCDTLRKVADSGLLAKVSTAYIGGGTPTLAGQGLVRLARAVSDACPAIEEFSVEANPDSLAPELVRALPDAGVTRVSLGVQSLDDAELRALGRVHDADQARRAAQSVVRAGLDLSCDLMCGVPGQTPQSWQRSLAGVVACGACHASCYPLSIEEGTPFDDLVLAGTMDLPDADLQADMMLQARDTLRSCGLERYEVASYSKPGHACRHNISYWTGRQYLGLGAAASSMVSAETAAALASCLDVEVCEDEGGRAPVSLRDFALGTGCADSQKSISRIRLAFAPDALAFIGACGSGAPLHATGERLDSREAAAEDLMLAMRMAAPLKACQLEELVARGIPRAALDRAVGTALSRGLIARGPDASIAPTQDGWLLGNELFGLMWDTACD